MRTYTSLWFASLLASATAWLLACTSLPPRLFWPGLLLPAVSLAALSGAAKFAFFGARVCENKLWFDPADAAAPAAAARACEIGEAAACGLAGVIVHVICAVLICLRRPQTRVAGDDSGKRARVEPGGAVTRDKKADGTCQDPERGDAVLARAASPSATGGHVDKVRRDTLSIDSDTSAPQVTTSRTQGTTTADPTFNGQRKKNRVVPPPIEVPPDANLSSSTDAEWNPCGRSIVVPIDDSCSDGSITHASSWSLGPTITSKNCGLPPRHSVSGASRTHRRTRSGSMKLSLPASPASQGSSDMLSRGMQYYSVISTTPRRKRLSGCSSGFSFSSMESNSARDCDNVPREIGSGVVTNRWHRQMSSGAGRLGPTQELQENPPLQDAMPATWEEPANNSEDHGDLINQCVRNLQKSFAVDGFHTI